MAPLRPGALLPLRLTVINQIASFQKQWFYQLNCFFKNCMCAQFPFWSFFVIQLKIVYATVVWFIRPKLLITFALFYITATLMFGKNQFDWPNHWQRVMHVMGQLKQWKWKKENQNGKQKWSNLDAHVNQGNSFD